MAENDLPAIKQMLKYAKVELEDKPGELKEVDLTCEVVWSAMCYLRDNPGSNIQDACAFGVEEWIK